jgi:hypothetical protein
VDYYNNQQLHSALGKIIPKDMLADRDEMIFNDRAHKLEVTGKRRLMLKVEKISVSI